jgi:hypothetical protein
MTPRVRKGLIVLLLHVALVSSLGAKLLVDRATRPRVWARVGPVDPSLPIRGRYVQLRLEGAVDDEVGAKYQGRFALTVRDHALVFLPTSENTGRSGRVVERPDGRRVAILHEPLAFFIPEHVPDPSRRAAGEELWVEVTLPRRGAPRPIRLGVLKNGTLTPLD